MYSTILLRYKVFIFLVVLFVLWQTLKYLPWMQPFEGIDIEHSPALSGAIKPVLVSIFYEALCPDSKNFIVKQLLPSVNRGAKLLDVSLIPYGKATTEEDSSGNIKFTCQHGPTECLANKIHACAISKITNTTLQVRYISCMISENMIPELIGENCAKELGISWISILQCSESQKGNELLKEFGKLTEISVPRISFVPTVLLDNKLKNQAAILKDFWKEVCSMFNEVQEECIST